MIKVPINLRIDPQQLKDVDEMVKGYKHNKNNSPRVLRMDRSRFIRLAIKEKLERESR